MTLDEQRQTRHFYRNHLRLAVKITFFSCMLSIILTLVVFYLALSRDEPAYYATNSAGFITNLMQLDGPNESNEALLEPDPPNKVAVKELDL